MVLFYKLACFLVGFIERLVSSEDRIRQSGHKFQDGAGLQYVQRGKIQNTFATSRALALRQMAPVDMGRRVSLPRIGLIAVAETRIQS
jgi:hypothetical protein